MTRRVVPRRLSSVAITLGLALGGAWPSGAPAVVQQSDQVWFSTPFLDIFERRDAGVELTAESIDLVTGGRRLPIYMVRPAAGGRLPAVVLAPGREGPAESFRQSAREIAGIGYVALVVDYRAEQEAGASALLRAVINSPNDLAAAVDWLSAHASVDMNRIGAIGWDESIERIAQLAETGKVSAAVVIGDGVCADSDPLFRVRRTPLLILTHSGAQACTSLPARFRTANLPHTIRIGNGPGVAERAWVEIYEFLGKHVEELPVSTSVVPREVEIARIVDIMRVISSDQGVRGRLARSLAAPPAGNEQWEQARSEAAIVAEAGTLLLARRPPRGSLLGWRQRATEFRTAAETLLRAIENRDFAAAQQSLRVLPQTCAACHADHR